jgi:hypothetical protein
VNDEGKLHVRLLRRAGGQVLCGSGREDRRVIRSVLYRNSLSALLFIVAVVGIFVQLREIHLGIVLPQTRLVLIAYFLIAIYAVASIALRLRGTRGKR